MLSKTVKDVFVVEDARLENQRREFDARLAEYERVTQKRRNSRYTHTSSAFERLQAETRATFRWIIFTIFAVNIVVAAYMTFILY